jgi:hypothetical protein
MLEVVVVVEGKFVVEKVVVTGEALRFISYIDSAENFIAGSFSIGFDSSQPNLERFTLTIVQSSLDSSSSSDSGSRYGDRRSCISSNHLVVR